MKRINILYIAVLVVVVILFAIIFRYSRNTIMFYGFAENQETEINLEYPVRVDKIYVIPGQSVAKGTLLAEASHNKMQLKLNELKFQIEELELEKAIWAANLQASIDMLESQKSLKIRKTESEISQINAAAEQNRRLIESLEGVSSPADSVSSNGLNSLRIQSLTDEMNLAVEGLDLEIKKYRDKLKASDNPLDVQIRKIEKDLEYYEANSVKISILAPTDGLIGNIHCMESENLSSFTSIISFYEENPTRVKGFVHESMILEVNVGDTLAVVSSLHPENRCLGIVTGLGTRIVEIPERLRKMPQVKNYGREVLIAIPPNNNFLQKEKVMLNLIDEEDKSEVQINQLRKVQLLDSSQGPV